MKKVIYLSIVFLMISLTMSAQAPGGQITRKKTNTTTTTAAPKKTTPTPQKTTPAPAKKKPQDVQQKRTAQQRSEAQKRAERERAAQTQAERERQEQEAREQAAREVELKRQQAVREQAEREAERSRILQNLISNMVYVEGGTFRMGNKDKLAWDNEKPVHQVTLSSFSIGRYEVTQEEWQIVMGNNPSVFYGAKRPVENVNWDDCQEFIRKLNAMTGRRFRLPTEAEWEYAARGGNRTCGYLYSGSNALNSVGWSSYNSDFQTHEVGRLQPNELGLYDMSGNVWEWCQDWYERYRSRAQTNPTGPRSGSLRVLRAGACRFSNRRDCNPSGRVKWENDSHGVRLAL